MFGLWVGCEPVPEVEIDFCDIGILDHDDVVRLRTQAGFSPIRAAGHDRGGDASFDIYGELVVTDRRLVVEHSILDRSWRNTADCQTGVIVLGVPNDRLSLFLRRAFRIRIVAPG